MEKISKETAIFTGITAGMAFLTGVLIGTNSNRELILSVLFFAGIILFAVGLLLFGNRINKI